MVAVYTFFSQLHTERWDFLIKYEVILPYAGESLKGAGSGRVEIIFHTR